MKMISSHSEKNLQNKCLGWLKSQPDVWYFKVCGSATQKRGVPDIIICKNGKFVAVELKTPKGTGRESEAQKITINQINSAGGNAFVTNDFETFKNTILNIG